MQKITSSVQISCRKAKALGAALTLFPEMWSNGYKIYDRPVEEWKAEEIPMLKGAELILVPNACPNDSRDTCILQADGAEGIYIAELDLAKLRQYRESEVHGNAYRHPAKYGLLVNTKIEKPFIREDYRA